MWRSLSWVVIANLSRQLAFLIVNAVLFERLSRATFGTISLAFGYMVVFVGLGDFGIRQVAWRAIARQPDRLRSLTGTMFSAKLVTLALAFGVYICLMPWLWTTGSPPSIYVLFGLGIFFNAVTFDFPFFGMSRVDLVARHSLIAFLIYFSACLLLVSGDARAWLVPVLLTSSMALLFALQLRWLRLNRGGFRLGVRVSEFRRILNDSWPLGLAETLSRLAVNYPLILIGMVLGSEGVGDYRIAELAYAFLAQFGHLIATAGFTQMSHSFHHRQAEVPAVLSRMLKPTVAGALLAGACLAALGPALIGGFFEGATPETMTVIRVLGIALAVAAPARLLKALLPSMDSQKSVLLVNVLTVTVGVVVGSVGVLYQGIVGMALGVLAAELSALVYLALVYRKALPRRLAGAPGESL